MERGPCDSSHGESGRRGGCRQDAPSLPCPCAPLLPLRLQLQQFLPPPDNPFIYDLLCQGINPLIRSEPCDLVIFQKPTSKHCTGDPATTHEPSMVHVIDSLLWHSSWDAQKVSLCTGLASRDHDSPPVQIHTVREYDDPFPSKSPTGAPHLLTQ